MPVLDYLKLVDILWMSISFRSWPALGTSSRLLARKPVNGPA
jgi:hypothetical protein